jgi:hypothetical protein
LPITHQLLKQWWVETNLSNICKHPYLTFAKAVNVIPQGEVKMDVRRENTVVRWVGFHPLMKQDKKAQIQNFYEKFDVHLPNCLNKQVLQNKIRHQFLVTTSGLYYKTITIANDDHK